MHIAVLSDTHMMRPRQSLVDAYDQVMREADAVLHCGDITGESVFAFLNAHARFYAVAGNMDTGQWADSLPRKTTVRVGEFRIGMVHGYGFGSSSLTHKVVEAFDPGTVDLVCFGHTHRRVFDTKGYGIPVLNPGSLALPKGSPAGFALCRLGLGQVPEVEWIDVSDT